MNNSLAVWWSNQKSKVSLDVNVFISSDEKKNYIEFGVKVKGAIKDDSLEDNFVCIYLPYEIYKSEVEDKVPELISNINLTKVLFNDGITVETESNNITVIKFNATKEKPYEDTAKDFRYMGLNNNFELISEYDSNSKMSNGTYIKINIKNNHNSDNYKSLYYRFRVNSLKKIIDEKDENYLYFDKFAKKIVYFDFNVNKLDKLPINIIDKFEEYKYKIESQNIFLKTDMSMNILFQSKNHKNIKVLADIWKKYMNVADEDDIIIYQWKEKEIFLKLSYIKKSKWLFFLLVAVIFVSITIGLNVSSNYVYDNYLKDNNISRVDK